MYMYFNLVKCGFIILAGSVLVLALCVNFFEARLPAAVVQTFRFGKFSYASGKKTFVDRLEVPKRWFRHFYVVAAAYSALSLCLLANAYLLRRPTADWVLALLDVAGSSERRVTCGATDAFVAVCLFSVQAWKRLYETFAVNVFSESRINVCHYVIGFCHYVGAFTALVMEAPGFAWPSYRHPNATTLSAQHVTAGTVAAALLFLWACYQQYRCAVILADLRKDETGAVVSYEHRVPQSGLFEWLSAPHMFCETLMYLALWAILWRHSTWPYVCLWVVCNQCENALLNHWWYKSTFKDYPTKRKAFVPFVL